MRTNMTTQNYDLRESILELVYIGFHAGKRSGNDRLPPPDTPTSTLTDTPTPTPLTNTPGKVTGGGAIGSAQVGTQATFGFTINYSEGDSTPKGNLTYQDHKNKLRLKATSFDFLVLDGDYVLIISIWIINGEQIVSFRIDIYVLNQLGSPDMFYISIPIITNYIAGCALNGGNMIIH